MNEEACPAWIFEDPSQSPLELLGLDIDEQCHYVCEAYLPNCMSDRGSDEGASLDEALASCVEDSGCKSNVCTTDSGLCDAARARFASARD